MTENSNITFTESWASGVERGSGLSTSFTINSVRDKYDIHVMPRALVLEVSPVHLNLNL